MTAKQTAAASRPEPAEIRAAVRDRALALGFDAVGFADAALGAEAREGLAAFLAAGHHGDMGWLETRREQRCHPQGLWPEAKSVVVLGMNYGPAEDPLALLDQPDRGSISVYARNRDYHDLLKKRLKALGRWMAETYGCQLKVFVDTAPVMEKPLAQRAGLGWQGKHSNLVSRGHGSWLFLGEVFTDLELPPDPPERDHCGACRRCLEVCPTDAFPAPYRLDARRCISYLTIEHKGHIDRAFRKAMKNRIYGCDDCLAVCPWNKFAAVATEPALLPRDELTAPRLGAFLGLDEVAFRRFFSGSPIKRVGRDRFLRNVLIAAGNAGDPDLVPPITGLLDDPSPLVRAMAVWALAELLPTGAFAALRQRHLPRETDPAVQAEWQPDQPPYSNGESGAGPGVQMKVTRNG